MNLRGIGRNSEFWAIIKKGSTIEIEAISELGKSMISGRDSRYTIVSIVGANVIAVQYGTPGTIKINGPNDSNFKIIAVIKDNLNIYFNKKED